MIIKLKLYLKNSGLEIEPNRNGEITKKLGQKKRIKNEVNKKLVYCICFVYGNTYQHRVNINLFHETR